VTVRKTKKSKKTTNCIAGKAFQKNKRLSRPLQLQTRPRRSRAMGFPKPRQIRRWWGNSHTPHVMRMAEKKNIVVSQQIEPGSVFPLERPGEKWAEATLSGWDGIGRCYVINPPTPSEVSAINPPWTWRTWLYPRDLILGGESGRWGRGVRLKAGPPDPILTIN